MNLGSTYFQRIGGDRVLNFQVAIAFSIFVVCELRSRSRFSSCDRVLISLPKGDRGFKLK